jgi:hypothetical protein
MDCDEDCECWLHWERLQAVNGYLADESELVELAREVGWPVVDTEIRLEELAAQCVRAMLERHPESFEKVEPEVAESRAKEVLISFSPVGY